MRSENLPEAKDNNLSEVPVGTLLRPLLPPNARAALFGIGAVLREDDYAGMYLMSLLAPIAGEDLLLVEGSTAPESCTGVIRSFKPDTVIVFDAARMGRQPGDYSVLSPDEISGATFSTHMLPLPVTLSYLEASCGCITAYVGIEPCSTGQGIGMDPHVKAGVERLAKELREVMRR